MIHNVRIYLICDYITSYEPHICALQNPDIMINIGSMYYCGIINLHIEIEYACQINTLDLFVI